MQLNEMAAKLREMANLLEGMKGGSVSQKAETRPASAPAPGEQVVDLSFVKVGETSSGKASLRIGYRNPAGETVYLSCFDEPIVDANRDLRKGMTVALRTKPWKDTYVITALRVVDSDVPF